MSQPSGASTASSVSVIGIIPVRLDSARLPGKVLMPLGGRPLLDHVLERARRIPALSDLVLATTDRPVDDPLEVYAQSRGLSLHRGFVDDVAGRVLAAAAGHDYFARLNGDSPFPDPALWSEAWDLTVLGRPDLVTNLVGRTFPYGISVEIVRRAALARALSEDGTPEDREHVTRVLYRRLDRLDVRTIRSPRPDLSVARLALDTEGDLARLERVVAVLGELSATADFATIADAALRATA